MRPIRPIGPIGLIGLIRLIRPIGPIGPIPIGLIGLIGLISLISCSKEQLSEPEPQWQDAICFNGGLQAETDIAAGTRAESVTPLSEKVQSFQVWAFKNKGISDNGGNSDDPIDYTNPQCVIPDYQVDYTANSANTTTTNSSGWEYVNGANQTIKYWDFDAKAYRFFGYAPATAQVTKWLYRPNGADGAWEEYEPYDVNWANGFVFTSFRLSVNVDASDEEHAPYISRMWFSNNAPNMIPYRSTVQLDFYKPLAKVRFMFIYADAELASKTIIKDQVFRPINLFAGIPVSGKIVVDFPLTGTSTKESWDVELEGYMRDSNGDNTYFTQNWYECDDTSSPLYAGREHWYTVLPVKSQGSYILTADINGADQSAVVPAEFMAWSPGYSYTYIFKITQDGNIIFDNVQVAIKKWAEMPEQMHHVYNW